MSSSEEKKLIEDMKAHVFTMAVEKWKVTGKKCAEIFEKNKVFKFIEDCYDSLHLESYKLVLEDVESLLKNKGVRINGKVA